MEKHNKDNSKEKTISKAMEQLYKYHQPHLL